MTETTASRFNEIVAIMDDQTWIWQLATSHLEFLALPHVRLPSDVPIRASWDRFKKAARIIVHWEAKARHGGAVIEEILDVQPSFDVGQRIIVLTTNPTHEDVVYFSELGVRRIIKLRNREKDLIQAGRELDMHLTAAQERDAREQAWHKLQYVFDTLPEVVPAEVITKLEDGVRRLKPADNLTARYLDALGTVFSLRGDDEGAVKHFMLALEKNPNHFRTFHNLIKQHRRLGRNLEAVKLMQKMQELNHANVSRLVGLGETVMEMGDPGRAEFYFKSALDRDQYCSGALNGLAEIRFHQGNLDESRQLLSRSHLAFKAAQRLNLQGIEMVKRSEFEKALEHYTRAQYVLPQQDKGPLLFYNIGLCYHRWSKLDMAQQFLKLAIIKEPTYKKAKKLLEVVEAKRSVASGIVIDDGEAA